MKDKNLLLLMTAVILVLGIAIYGYQIKRSEKIPRPDARYNIYIRVPNCTDCYAVKELGKEWKFSRPDRVIDYFMSIRQSYIDSCHKQNESLAVIAAVNKTRGVIKEIQENRKELKSLSRALIYQRGWMDGAKRFAYNDKTGKQWKSLLKIDSTKFAHYLPL